jgi:hypothetical protein
MIKLDDTLNNASGNHPTAEDEDNWNIESPAGESDMVLLNEVLESVERGLDGSDGAYEHWRRTFYEQDHRFKSVLLVCEMKYKELLEVGS